MLSKLYAKLGSFSGTVRKGVNVNLSESYTNFLFLLIEYRNNDDRIGSTLVSVETLKTSNYVTVSTGSAVTDMKLLGIKINDKNAEVDTVTAQGTAEGHGITIYGIFRNSYENS